MLGCSLILSLGAITEKYLLTTQVDWINLFFWSQVFTVITVLLMPLVPACRKDIISDMAVVKSIVGINLFQGMTRIGSIF